ncbi:DUF2064 domain-containing protein [Plantactinospora sp. GCM10030261]|uniref:TIGR04282 family arsenosugar biosynthesis glycosyltransferase n=1 Tax=Plantactinospora sp. GCM10030261 TaxID=3273420 RepID=UPI00360C6D5C
MTILLVMAKAPVPGAVKTRLCPPASPRQAAAVAAAALLDTIDAVRATPGVVPVLACAGRLGDAVRAADLAAALTGWRIVPQRGAGFADRLANAHADAAMMAPARPVLQIGMDTPQVRPADLTAAVARLKAADAVLGPATDGGWWALGLRDAALADVLRTVPMSTPNTGSLTRAALAGCGSRVVDADTLTDVDTWATAREVASMAPGGRFAATVAGVAATLAVPASGTRLVGEVRR